MSTLKIPAELSKARVSDLTRDQIIDILDANGEAGIRVDFSGKTGARKLARLVRPRVACDFTELGFGEAEDRARNTLVQGDNLQAMVTLYKERGGVDLIVTDPPYNTGNDFRYNDKWEEDPNDSEIGDFVSVEDTARHTKWMRFMWPRLQMMKAMLKPSGVLAICIDYREMFYLGQMLDELFERKNRLGIINWQRTYTVTNDADHVATTTEYVLVYAKSESRAQTRLLPRENEKKTTAVPDSDPRPWTDGPATGSNAKAHKSMVYGIQSPFTGEILYPPAGSAWRQGQDRNFEQILGWKAKYKFHDLKDAKKRAQVIGVPISEVPEVKGIILSEPLSKARKKATEVLNQGIWPRFFFLARGMGRPRLKKYLDEMQEGFVPTTYWSSEGIDAPTPEALQTEPARIDSVSWSHRYAGHSQQGVTELTAIVGPGHEFKTVKPMKLFQKIIQIWCPDDGVVLDPFAGSGTTGHVVLDMNEKGANRRFILIEQGRPERGDSYAETLTADRLRRACSGKWATGKQPPTRGGFSFHKLGKKVDSSVLLRMERDEMLDTVISSHFDASRRRGDRLIRILGERKAFKYLIAKNSENEGFFLIWDGPNKNTDFTERVYEACAEEAARARLASSPYHIYARLYRYQTEGVRFYQIPDRILSDFGLDVRSEPFSESGADE